MPVAAWGAAADSTTTPPPVVVTPPTGPDFPRGRISGYMFGDLYYNTVGDPNAVYDANGNDTRKVNIDNVPKPIGEGLNGVQLRRIYFQLDNDLSVRFATRFRLEADSKSLTSDGKLGVNVKNAYLQVKSALPRTDFYFGMMTTAIFENPEAFWGYRSIEKTIGDFRGVSPSADLGIELKGFADPNHHYGYAAMMGNGAGQKPETNRYKRYSLALPLRFGELRVEPYIDYENVHQTVPGAAGNYDRATYKVFGGYEFRRAALGVEALTQNLHQPVGGSMEPRGLSVFARGTATPTVAAYARFDHWIPDNNAANRIDSQLWIAGFDWQPFHDVHIEPNIEATQYLKKGNPANFPAHHDFQARITFYYLFSKPQS